MKGICGLANRGNTCYMNASLQIFSQMHELNNYLLTVQNVKNCADSIVTFEWIQLFRMIQDNHGSITPNRFIERMSHAAIQKNRQEFSSGEQNDSVDFFEFMLECFHNSLNGLDSSIREKRNRENQVEKYLEQIEEKDHSIVSRLFLSGFIYQYVNPVNMKIEFYKIEHEYHLSLSIPDKSNVTIQDCFMETFKEEILTGENAWFDEKENVKKTVLKRSFLCHTPRLLILHFKRWKPNMTKKNNKIDTPFLLDIQAFTVYKESCEYQLFGVINHEGGIHGGHYYASIQKEGVWFSVNDHSIQSISPEHIIHESNYCLFYRKIK